ncbi:PPOX class F420-dependent oxidoreductase [Umezawaea beigongshangensis]|uniref:PPOX class F420-dependent oxidoreductase n=1 Tax=Umezawaea beigongshangensis TaxID=2780383 RepID=UPI001E6458BA|nr:PPOX class F420-dependent oxidoreductase [Umezawaea beigongshangensis]
MGIFTEAESDYLRSGPTRELLARIATVGEDGTPHVCPVGWRLDPDTEAIEIGGRDMERSKKFRDVGRTHRAAVVVDDVLPPWVPRGIEIRGRAEAVDGPEPLIRIHPEWVTSWGIDGRRHTRTTG